MTLDDALFLASDEGRDLLARAEGLQAARAGTLPALTRLRKVASPARSAAAWEQAGLRRRAVTKFGSDANGMLFTRESLEQASGAGAAAYHAARLAGAGCAALSDLCGGIGGDALAFARRGLRVTLYESDPVRALFARINAQVLGLTLLITVHEQDVVDAALSPGPAWFDPARRKAGRRIAGPEDYLPPLSFVHKLAAQGIVDIGVKLSPAIPHALAGEYGAALEFLSAGGECKEALLWRGVLGTPGTIQATVLTPDGPQMLAATPDNPPPPVEGSPRAAFLYEPDPAVIRAHAVAPLARLLDARLVDPHIAYLVADGYTPTPFAEAYPILERFPYHLRRLQEVLRRLDCGSVVVKKRGVPHEPDAVRQSLRLTGGQPRVVVLTRLGDTHHAFVCGPRRVG